MVIYRNKQNNKKQTAVLYPADSLRSYAKNITVES